MADAVFYQGDEQPYMGAQLLRGGVPIDLTTATGVSFKMYRKDHEAYESPLAEGACDVTVALTGNVEYPWDPADLATASGRMSVVFTIDWSGKPEAVPDTGFIEVTVIGAAT